MNRRSENNGLVIDTVENGLGKNGHISFNRNAAHDADAADRTNQRKNTLRWTFGEIASEETFLDHFQWKEVIALLSEDPPQAFDILIVELSVARWCSFRVQ